MTLTPIHIFKLRGPGGERCVAIPGDYCAARTPHLRDGEHVVDKTWRSDWRYLGHAANSQPAYMGPAPR